MTIIRGLAMEEYLRNGAVSHSRLKDFAISPKLFETKWRKPALAALLEDDDEESVKEAVKASRALLFGQAYETYLTDMRGFDALYIQKPADGPCSNFSTKEGKAWKAEALGAGKVILTVKEFCQLREMRESFLENDDAVELLEGCEKQVTLDCHWPEGEMYTNEGDSSGTVLVPRGVLLQSRPDFLNLKGNAQSDWRPYSVDLKTVDHMERFYNARAPLDYGYHRQAEIVRITMRENGYGDSVHYLLASEKSSPNLTEVFKVDDELLDAASPWVFNQCLDLANAIASEHFPRARESGIRVMHKPAWLRSGEEY